MLTEFFIILMFQLPLISLLVSIIYLIVSRYYKSFKTISFYSFGFAILNCGIESFLLDYTDSNRIDDTLLYSIRIFQLIL